MKSLFSELVRRNIPRVAGVYVMVSWLVMQVTSVMTPALNLPDWVDSFFAVALIIGFPIALIFAWAFELTADGVRRTEVLADGDVSENRVGRKLDIILVVGLFIVGGLLISDRFRSDMIVTPITADQAMPSTPEQGTSIAVMAFADMSPGQDQEYFADGLSEELLNLLAQIPDLRVAGRTSSFAFKNKDAQIEEIAEALHVGTVLEGSVRMDGQKIRITAQLIDGSNGYHLWSKSYNRELDDIFSVQDDIAAQVVETLKVNLLGEVPKVYTAKPEAYALYLRGRHLQQQYTKTSMGEALKLFQNVAELDPDYAPVWTNIASNYINQMSSGNLDVKQGCALAREAADASLLIDPEFPAAYSKLAALVNGCDNNRQLAAEYYEKALKLAPRNPSVLGDAAVLAESLGRLDLAIKVKEYQVRQQPVDAIAHNNLALAYYFKGRYADAETAIRTALSISPDYIGAQYRLGAILLVNGDPKGALAAFEREKDDEYRTKGEAIAHYALGNTIQADASLQALVDGWGETWPTEIAQAYAYRGETDKAFEYLEKRFESGGPNGWGEQSLDPLFAGLYGDPRWDEFLEKMGLSDADLDAIDFNFTVPE